MDERPKALSRRFETGAIAHGRGRKSASDQLRWLAKRIVDEALQRVPLRAALLAGSAGRGDADCYSDIDLLLYVDEVPPEQVLAEIRMAVGGINPIPKGEPSEHVRGEEFELEGVRTEVTFFSWSWSEERLSELFERIEDFDSLLQKVLMGILDGLPLYGEDLLEQRRLRVKTYPEPLRRAMVERHWDFFPLWYYADAIAARDAELWRLDVLLEAAFNLLAVLAALNRLYFTRFHFKKMRALIAEMEQAPPGLADRLESLFRLDPAPAAAELERLIEETRTLVAAQFPDLELPLKFPTGMRQRPWMVAPKGWRRA